MSKHTWAAKFPAACRATPGVLDLGFCAIDLKKV
jgi:hypothetical protein